MSYYELRQKMIELSKMLTRARAEKRAREVIERIQYAIENVREQIAECIQ